MATIQDLMLREQSSDPLARADVGREVPRSPGWAKPVKRTLADVMKGADSFANDMLNPNSGMDILRWIDQRPEIAQWLTMNMTPPGQMIQGSMDVSEAVSNSDAPWQNRLAQGAAGVLGMATAPLGVDTRLAGTAAKGLNKLDDFARSGELARPLQNEYGVFVGPGAKGWDEIPGKFSSLADRMERAEIDDSGMRFNFNALPDNIYSPQNIQTKLPDIAQHDDLYSRYPFLRDVHVMNSDIAGEKGATMVSSQKGGLPTITLNKSILSPNEAEQVFLHEIQHAIQEKEGFARGGSPGAMVQDVYNAKENFSKYDRLRQQTYDAAMDQARYMVNDPKHSEVVNEAMEKYSKTVGEKSDFNPLGVDRVTALAWKIAEDNGATRYAELANQYRSMSKMDAQDAYKSLAGEIEARDVASRANLTPEQRMTTPPYSSEDIPLSDWIVRKGGGGPAMSIDDPDLKNAPWRQGQIEGYVEDPVERQKNFDAWFGDSKVVDESGKPMMVYHGTTKKFDAFDTKKSARTDRATSRHFGFFFADNEGEASRYAEWNGANGEIKPVYLSVRNPYEMPYDEFDAYSMHTFNRMKENGFRFSDDDVKKWDKESVKSVKDKKRQLQKLGHDGILVKNKDGDTLEYIAFEPTQIKSKFNRGTYDPKDPRILYGAMPLAAMAQDDDNDPVIQNAPWRR